MKLEYILELMIKAQARLEDGHINYTATAIDEAIDELKKVIAENDKMKNMGATAPDKEEPQDEIVHVAHLILQNQHEEEFWANCYLAAASLNIYGNPPEFIADIAIFELRKRLGKSE